MLKATLSTMASLAACGLALITQVAKADNVFNYDAGEKVIFSDTFADATKGWILDANTEIKDSKWGPKAANVPGSWVGSSVNLPAPITLANGPIAIYFGFSTNLPGGGDSCKIQVILGVQATNRFAEISIIPRAQLTHIYLMGRNKDGKGIAAILPIQDDLVKFKTAGQRIDYRMRVSQKDGVVTMEPSVWDGKSWHPLGTATADSDGSQFDMGSGIFSNLMISTRNQSPSSQDARSFFGAIAVTQAPASVPSPAPAPAK